MRRQVRNTVIVEVSEGVVQTVYASYDLIHHLEVTVLDHDDVKARGHMVKSEEKAAQLIEHGKVKLISYN